MKDAELLTQFEDCTKQYDPCGAAILVARLKAVQAHMDELERIAALKTDEMLAEIAGYVLLHGYATSGRVHALFKRIEELQENVERK